MQLSDPGDRLPLGEAPTKTHAFVVCQDRFREPTDTHNTAQRGEHEC